MESTAVLPNLSDSWSVPIDKLMQWRANQWVRYLNIPTNLFLTLNYDQLIINSAEKVIESLSLHGKIKGFSRADVVIIVFNDTVQGLRKVKFQLKINALQCIEKLRIHFPVLNHDCVPSKNIFSNYMRIEDLVKKVIQETGTEFSDCVTSLPPNFSNFVKFCIMDPTFPQFVHETQKVIKSLSSETK